MAIYKSDVAARGVPLRLRNQELEGEIQGLIEVPVGTVFATGDDVELFDLAPNTYLTYLRIRFPGMDEGADGGFESTVGYASEGTLLSPDPDVDAYMAAADDGAGTFVEADLTGTNGTAFPGAGPAGGKAMYDNDIVHVLMSVDNASPTEPVTEGFNQITFVARYTRIAIDGADQASDIGQAPFNFPADVPVLTMDYNGEGTGG